MYKQNVYSTFKNSFMTKVFSTQTLNLYYLECLHMHNFSAIVLAQRIIYN